MDTKTLAQPLRLLGALLTMAVLIASLVALEQPHGSSERARLVLSIVSVCASLAFLTSNAQVVNGGEWSRSARAWHAAIFGAALYAVLSPGTVGPLLRVLIVKAAFSAVSVTAGVGLASGAAPLRRRRVLLGAVLVHAFMVNMLLTWDRIAGTALHLAATLTLLSAIAVCGAFLIARDLGAGPSEAPPAIDPFLDDEAAWIRRRREESGVPLDAMKVGLALSGGGIRSATVSLGFLRELARRRFLRRIDVLSTVSGGGWAGGALTAAATRLPPRADIEDDRLWERLVARFRRRRAYLFPEGGARVVDLAFLTARVVSGAIANSSIALCVVFAIAVLLPQISRSERGSRVAPLVMTLVEATPTALRAWLPFEVGGDLAALNLASLSFFTLAAIALVSFAVTVGSYTRGVRGGVPEALARTSSTALVMTAGFGLVHLILCGSRWVTILVFALVLGLVLRRLLRRMSWETFAAAAISVVASDRFAPTVRAVICSVTQSWYSGLLVALRLPSHLARGAYEQLGAHPKYASGLLQNHLPLVAALLIAGLALSLQIDRNRTSLHGYWSHRIARAFLHDDQGDPVTMDAVANQHVGPFHVVSCAVNLPGSEEPSLLGRGTEHFEFTPCAFGSARTGWARPARYGSDVSFDDVIGISAAALNSQGGVAIPTALTPLLATLNLRLGYWLRNPRDAMATGALSRFRRIARLWSLHATLETLDLNSEDDSMVLVSDGGHHDNLGLLGLVRRRVPLILCVDAAADPGYRFADLGRTLHLLREEGWNNDGLDIDVMRPTGGSLQWSDRVVAHPVQPFRLKHCDGTTLTVVYIKSSLTNQAPYDVRAYAEQESCFPQQSTLDQTFDSWQFDAYFSVGQHLADLALNRLRAIDGVDWRPATIADDCSAG